MTTLYLHIGNHRTATSSIQAFMLANWETLLSRGVLHPMRVGRHFALFNAIFSGRRTVKEVAQDLMTRAKKHPFDVHSIVLSDEDVCMRTDLTPLAEFKDHFDVKVVFAAAAPGRGAGQIPVASGSRGQAGRQHPGARRTLSLLMDHSTWMEIINRHAKGNANVARKYFNRETLFLEPLPALHAPLAQMVLPQDSGVLMRDYLAPMVRGLIGNMLTLP